MWALEYSFISEKLCFSEMFGLVHFLRMRLDSPWRPIKLMQRFQWRALYIVERPSDFSMKLLLCQLGSSG